MSANGSGIHRQANGRAAKGREGGERASNGRASVERDASAGLNLVVLGLSISSSWGNGHATTYRSLLRALAARGHRITFLERDVPWYASSRDLPDPSYCRLILYDGVDELRRRYADELRRADVVMIGSFVPDGVDVARWALGTAEGPVAFYDIDTPVTLGKMERGDFEYIAPDLVPEFDLYLSFTGGMALERLENEYRARAARPLYCSVDPDDYYPDESGSKDSAFEDARPGRAPLDYDLGYMGTYSVDRQPGLESMLLDAARAWPDGRFIVAGPGYPDDTSWPDNVRHVHHLPPAEHRSFYNAQRFTLNVTRADMVRAGYAPSVRLFEAAACGTPIISDYWQGIETILTPDREILISRSAEDTLRYLRAMSEEERVEIGRRARGRILSAHTSAHRAKELESYLTDVLESRKPSLTE